MFASGLRCQVSVTRWPINEVQCHRLEKSNLCGALARFVCFMLLWLSPLGQCNHRSLKFIFEHHESP